MKTLLLIDAYAMIYRAYYAFIRAPRMNSKGENTSAVYGFATTLDDLLRRLKPTHIAVAFDPHGPTFRHEAYEAYKAQREETPEDIRRAVPIIKRLLQAMNIPAIEVDGFEADDVIGTLAKQAEQQDFVVFMATPDKDYGQLVTDRIFMYRPRHTGGFEQLGPKEVCEKYGLHNQSQVIDLLGLMGDASDNIPGCKGVGEKTAVQLLQQFGSIDNMLANTDQLRGALQQKVQTQAEQIRFSRFLATIRTDVPIRMESLDLAKKDADIEALTRLYQELEFTSLLKKLSPAQDPAPKKTKTAAQGLTLDLFAEEVAPVIKSPEEERREQEARLCSYLLNPEVAFNPAVEPNWEALKADANLWALYEEVELPLMSVLREMEEAGVRIDVAKLKEAEHQLTAELEALEQEIYTMAGTTLNINSPRQVGDLLFETMHLSDKAKKSKTGQYSTSEEVLLGIKDRHPIVGKILDYRELKKLISTYVTSLPGYINPQTGKIHTTYNQTVTATGRLSSSNPNLQNLPIRSERGKLIREAVIPDPGCLFLSADYSQIELRLLAHFSGDEHMQEAFRQGQDIHAATAAKIFRIPIEQVTADQRRRAKTANFGIIYGISAFGLSQQLDCSRAEAKALIDGYFEAFPRVVDYIESQKQKAREKGYAETLFGRRRYLPDILSQNATVRSFAERNAVNAPIQGTAADIIKMAMVSISRRLHMEQLRAQMIMQVHDELNFNVPEDEVERVREIVVGEMQHVVHLSIPLIADCGVGNNWLEAH
ncbi:MAG: DNA polymerase I [Paludibacteraceae bacterium]|jgi:DNA polymerase I-like protein with 3'-5' exonuclease and polymerase domains|nr:DNA polymerase I [Paludibacteraceae bacterium]